MKRFIPSKFFKYFIAILIMILISAVHVFAQDTTTTPIPIQLPEGFNWIYLIFFAVGMVIHYAYKIFRTFGTATFFAKFASNLFAWFFNKFHWTLVAGGAAAILGIAVQYGLPAEFATLNVLGVVLALASGYIGDIANKGDLK